MVGGERGWWVVSEFWDPFACVMSDDGTYKVGSNAFGFEAG